MSHCGALAVHPHVRGDNFSPSFNGLVIDGSPPRAWGQPEVPRPKTTLPRFTPTCVGTTAMLQAPLVYPAVHPHVRGDNQVSGFDSAGNFGSPPRAWGQLHPRTFHYPASRFTPTCVGTTLHTSR